MMCWRCEKEWNLPYGKEKVPSHCPCCLRSFSQAEILAYEKAQTKASPRG